MDRTTSQLFDAAEPHRYDPVEPIAASSALVTLGQRLPRSVHLGAACWNFPGWRGLVWSEKSGTAGLTQRGLAAYSAFPLFRATGVDQGYYRPLTQKQYESFAAQVPANFRFLTKAPAAITDWAIRGRRGEALGRNPTYLNAQKALEEFIYPVAAGLQEKTGPLVFEFSPIPRDAVRDLNDRYREIAAITEFLASLPHEVAGRQLLYGAEMRTRVLLTPRYVKALRPSGVRLVVGIHPSLPSILSQMDALRLLDDPDNDSQHWRLHGDLIVRWSIAQGGRYEELKRDWRPYNAIQRADIVVREGVALLVEKAVKSGVQSFVTANNKAEGSAPLTMQALAERIEERLALERLKKQL